MRLPSKGLGDLAGLGRGAALGLAARLRRCLNHPCWIQLSTGYVTGQPRVSLTNHTFSCQTAPTCRGSAPTRSGHKGFTRPRNSCVCRWGLIPGRDRKQSCGVAFPFARLVVGGGGVLGSWCH